MLIALGSRRLVAPAQRQRGFLDGEQVRTSVAVFESGHILDRDIGPLTAGNWFTTIDGHAVTRFETIKAR
jgi:hypothetical protein